MSIPGSRGSSRGESNRHPCHLAKKQSERAGSSDRNGRDLQSVAIISNARAQHFVYRLGLRKPKPTSTLMGPY